MGASDICENDEISKISKKYISDIWEKMADIWQQNTSRTYGKIWRTYDCHPNFHLDTLKFAFQRLIKKFFIVDYTHILIRRMYETL
jgi:hypothetical protein